MTIILPPAPAPAHPTRALADRVVAATHEAYAALPSHGKPQVRSNGVPEWTIIASIALLVPADLPPLPRVKKVGSGLAPNSPAPSSASAPSAPGRPRPSSRASSSKNASASSSARSTPKSSPQSSPGSSPNPKSSPLPPVPTGLASSCSSASSSSRAPVDLEPHVEIVSVGTGVKCLPANRLPPLGDTLHDSHAEVICRRGFVHWLLYESKLVLRGQKNKGVIAWDGERLRLRDGVKVVLYVSALPCGDASTLHTAAHQPAEMAALKASNLSVPVLFKPGAAVRGRNGYENYGAIRTKPGRADSIPTTSFSCSDKIASWNVLGLQGGLLADLFDPVYLDLVVVGGVEEEAPAGVKSDGDWHGRIGKEVERALCRRMTGIEDHLPPPYHLHVPEVCLTTIPFAYSKPAVTGASDREPAPAVVSLSHIPPTGQAGEVIHNGARQGGPWRPPGLVPIPAKKRTRLCKLELMRSYFELLSLAQPDAPTDATYHDTKHTWTSLYQVAKCVLRGVPLVATPPPFNAYVPASCFSTCAGGNGAGHSPPFRGWIVTGAAFESFTQGGELVDEGGEVREAVVAAQTRRSAVEAAGKDEAGAGAAAPEPEAAGQADAKLSAEAGAAEPEQDAAGEAGAELPAHGIAAGVVDAMSRSLGALGAAARSALDGAAAATTE